MACLGRITSTVHMISALDQPGRKRMYQNYKRNAKSLLSYIIYVIAGHQYIFVSFFNGVRWNLKIVRNLSFFTFIMRPIRGRFAIIFLCTRTWKMSSCTYLEKRWHCKDLFSSYNQSNINWSNSTLAHLSILHLNMIHVKSSHV